MIQSTRNLRGGASTPTFLGEGVDYSQRRDRWNKIAYLINIKPCLIYFHAGTVVEQAEELATNGRTCVDACIEFDTSVDRSARIAPRNDLVTNMGACIQVQVHRSVCVYLQVHRRLSKPLERAYAELDLGDDVDANGALSGGIWVSEELEG